MKTPSTPKTRLLRFSEVIERTGKSRSAIYVLVNKGEFPTPVKLGPRSVAFVEGEIDEWIEAKLASRVEGRNEHGVKGADYE